MIDGTRFYCYPATQDSWRRQVASVGHAARDVAREAAAAGVMIVAATGNNNGGTEGYCTPWGDPGCADRAVLAEHVSEFAWASRHWTGSDPNPIFLAEAIGKNGELASFSNRGGDIAAPGVDVGSTGKTPPYKTESGTSLAAPHVTAAIGYLLADDPDLGIDEIRDRLLGWGRQPTLKTRANLFDWSVRDRIGYDDDVNGRVDYDLPRGSNPPESYPVDLQACGSAVNGKPALAYRWTLNGETIEQTGCALRYEFPNEGNYDVKLELLGDDGASATRDAHGHRRRRARRRARRRLRRRRGGTRPVRRDGLRQSGLAEPELPPLGQVRRRAVGALARARRRQRLRFARAARLRRRPHPGRPRRGRQLRAGPERERRPALAVLRPERPGAAGAAVGAAGRDRRPHPGRRRPLGRRRGSPPRRHPGRLPPARPDLRHRRRRRDPQPAAAAARRPLRRARRGDRRPRHPARAMSSSPSTPTSRGTTTRPPTSTASGSRTPRPSG